MNRCRDCGADILFARTEAGKLMPLDPERLDRGDPDANVAVTRDHTGRLLARVLKDGEDPYRHEWRAIPHFATCLPLLAQAGRVDGVVSLARRREGKR